MRVYFRPLLLGGNPYTRELVAALEAEGIEVCGSAGRGISFARHALSQGARVVHLHWLWGVTSRGGRWMARARLGYFLAQLLLLRVLGRGIVLTVHNLYPHESPHPDVDRLCTRAVIAIAHRTLVHGDSAKEVLQRELGLGERTVARLVTVPHAHYADVYPDRISRTRARAVLGIGEDRFVFGNLGMIRPYKGIPALIDAFRSIGGDDIELVIAGRPIDGPYRAEIERRIAGDPRIRFFPGFVAEDEVQTYLKAADVMVYPFENVLSSGSVILALSMARTCVCPEVGCIRDIASPDDAYLYSPDDPDGLRNAMLRAIADRNNTEGKGRRGLERVLAWSWEHSARCTAEIYRGLAGERVARGSEVGGTAGA